jgi:hypothetical protein
VRNSLNERGRPTHGGDLRYTVGFHGGVGQRVDPDRAALSLGDGGRRPEVVPGLAAHLGIVANVHRLAESTPNHATSSAAQRRWTPGPIDVPYRPGSALCPADPLGRTDLTLMRLP